MVSHFLGHRIECVLPSIVIFLLSCSVYACFGDNQVDTDPTTAQSTCGNSS